MDRRAHRGLPAITPVWVMADESLVASLRSTRIGIGTAPPRRDIARSDGPDRHDRPSSPECDGLGLAAGPSRNSPGSCPMADDTSAARASPAPAAGGSPPATGIPEGGQAGPRLADPRRGRREPEPVGRQRRPAVDRARVRCVADAAEPGRGRLLAGPRGVRAVAGGPRRSLRPQADADPRRRPVGAGLHPGGLAPSIEVLIFARIFGGVSAGMAYPTTLALIAALWSGAGRTARSRCGRRSVARSRPWAR